MYATGTVPGPRSKAAPDLSVARLSFASVRDGTEGVTYALSEVREDLTRSAGVYRSLPCEELTPWSSSSLCLSPNSDPAPLPPVLREGRGSK